MQGEHLPHQQAQFITKCIYAVSLHMASNTDGVDVHTDHFLEIRLPHLHPCLAHPQAGNITHTTQEDLLLIQVPDTVLLVVLHFLDAKADGRLILLPA